MKKRILSIVLSIVMLISLLPTTALAMASDTVYIDGVYMGDGNISTYYKNGDTDATTGSESDYNAKLWKNGDVLTLTLNGLNLTSTSQYGIRANADLTIVLEGENTVKAADTVGKDSYGIFTLNALTFSGTGTLNVSGGKTDGYQTCAIYANGDLTMNGGTVIATGGATGDNYGESFGISVSTFNMNNGVVTATGGDSDKSSYGIRATTLNVTGGTVTATGGNPTHSGGSYGVNATVTVSGGELTATGGTAAGGNNSYGILGNATVTGGTMTASGQTQAFSAEPTITSVCTVNAGEDEENISSVDKNTNLTTYKYVKVVSEPPHSHCVCGDDKCSGDGHDPSQVWIATNELPNSSGHYYLTADVEIASTWKPADDTMLCLNGHTIRMTGSGDVIEAENFTLTDCRTPQGEITHSSGATGDGVIVKNNGTFYMYGGNITGNNNSGNGGGVKVSYGTFNMYGGSITNNKAPSGYNGGGVYINSSSPLNNTLNTFNMYGGTISGNVATSGGGVYVRNNATFNMYGGDIIDNKATYGGGVYMLDTTSAFTMTDGSISSNTAANNGGGVYVNNNSFTVSGSPVITGNTVSDKANNVYLPSGITITVNGALTGGNNSIGVKMDEPGVFAEPDGTNVKSLAGYVNFFTSDDANYKPAEAGNNLSLVTTHEHGNWRYSYDDNSTGGIITATCGNSCPTGYSVTATVVVDNSNTYDGNARRPVSVHYSDAWLDAEAGTVNITGAEILVGTGSATLSIGNLSIPVEFTIGKADPQASDFTVTLPTNLTYDGTAKVATVTENRGNLDPSKIIVQYAHQDRDPTDPIDAKGYAVMITLAENDYYNIPSETLLFGEDGNFVIAQKDISQSDVSIDAIPDQTYTGSAIKPPLTVKYTVSENNVITLEKDRDYTVAYGENTNIGENAGSVTIEGQGNYTGTKTVNFTIDYASMTAQEAFGYTYDPNAWVNTDITFTAKNGYTVSDTAAGSGYDSTCTGTEEGHGVTKTVYVKDSEGKVSLVELKYNLDKTTPVISAVSGNPDSWTKEDATVSFNVEDALSGIASVVVTCDDNQSVTYTNNSFTADRNGTYTITATDKAGNQKSETVTVTKIDKTVPVISAVAIAPVVAGDWYTSNPTVTVTATDGESGLDAAAYSFDGGTNWQTTNTKAYTEDGTYTVTVWVTDAVGNIAKWNPETIKVDTTAPDAITVTAKVGTDDYTPGSEARADVVITLTGGEDALSGFDKYQYKIGDEDSWQDISGSTFTHTASTNETGVTYTFRAVDMADNASDEVEFTVKKSFPVRFNANIAGATGTMEDTYIYQRGAVVMPACGFTKAGYSLVGWYTSADCTGECYLVGNELTNITESADGGFDLYAKWQIDEYSVTILLNGTGAEGPADFKYTVESDAITLTKPTRTGYTFKGWSGTGLEGDANLTVTIPIGSTGDRSYTANWTPITYDISYTLNGGIATNPAGYTIESEDITLVKPTREGYTFKGWSSTGLEGDTNLNVTIAAGSVGDRTYTANWTANEYTITYEGMDGAAYGENNPVKHTYDTPTAVSNPTKTGYTFAGWKVNGGEAQTALTLAGDGYTSDITLTATWTANSYKVVFNANGGEGEMAEQSFTYDAAQVLTENAFTREGYKFVGWVEIADSTGVDYVDQQNVNNLTAELDGDVTLYAVWTRDIILSGDVIAPNVPNAEKLEVVLVGLDGTKYPVSVTGNASPYHYTVTVPEGEYQLVIKDTQRDVTVTAKEELTEDKAEELITMPEGSVNSIVDSTAAGDYTPIVGGLDDIAGDVANENAGVDVTVTLTVSHVLANEEDAEHDALMDAAGSQKSKLTFLEIDLEKNVDTVISSITETDDVIEIIVPFDTTRKQNFKVYRFHDGPVDVLTTTANTDGEYIEIGTGSVTIHAKKFSLYAIGYNDVIPYYPVVHSCISKCDVCGGCEDAACTESACKDKCRLLGMNFTDVAEGKWYTEPVEYVYHHKMMEGVGNNLFDINGTTTRAMIVTILWRLEGSPIVNYAMDFEDVATDQWYTEAIRWAASENIVEGYGNGQFGTNDAITREQMVTIMFRYAKYKGYDVSVGENTNILSYDDAFDVAEWAIPSMQWACGSGMIQGIADGNHMNLAPQGNATRAQAAAILQRFCENVANKK